MKERIKLCEFWFHIKRYVSNLVLNFQNFSWKLKFLLKKNHNKNGSFWNFEVLYLAQKLLKYFEISIILVSYLYKHINIIYIDYI